MSRSLPSLAPSWSSAPVILWAAATLSCGRINYGPAPEQAPGPLLWSYAGNVTAAQAQAFNTAVNEDPNTTGIPNALKLDDGWFRMGTLGHRCSIEADRRLECVLPSTEPSRFSMLEANLGGNPDAGWLDGHRSSLIGQRYRYEFELFLADGFLSRDTGGRFVGFGQIADTSEERGARAPPLMLTVSGGTWTMRVIGDSRPISLAPDFQRDETFDLGPVTEEGRWTRWTLDVTWAFDARGQLSVTRNGRVVHDESALQNCFNDGPERGPLWSFGVRVSNESEASEVRYAFRNLRLYEIRSE